MKIKIKNKKNFRFEQTLERRIVKRGICWLYDARMGIDRTLELWQRVKTYDKGAEDENIGEKPRVGLQDPFLQECERIYRLISSLQAFLRGIRGPYLHDTKRNGNGGAIGTGTDWKSRLVSGNVPLALTDSERYEIDDQMSLILRQTLSQLKTLESIEQERSAVVERHTKKLLGFLKRDAARQQKQLGDLRAGVLHSLRLKLSNLINIQREMQEQREASLLEKNKSMIESNPLTVSPSALTGMNMTPERSAIINDSIEQQPDLNLSDQERQLLEQENAEMMGEYASELDKALATEKSVVEISQLSAQLTGLLDAQAYQISSLKEDAIVTAQTISAGNIQLQKARERNSRTIRFVFAFLIVSSIIMLTADRYN